MQLTYEMKADYAILKESCTVEIVAEFIKHKQGYKEREIYILHTKDINLIKIKRKSI